MEWRDEGILLSTRPHGEGSAIIDVLTAAHGRHLGVVRGGASRRMAPLLQPGAALALSWRARLEEHIGGVTVEPLQSRAAILGDPLALSALGAICALARIALPEREPHPRLYRLTAALLDRMDGGDDWLALYAGWELALLEDLGFGLDLASCAVTGQEADLAFISPRTGRAVSRQGAGDWAPRLFPMPQAFRPGAAVDAPALHAALEVTGHFLQRELSDRLRGGTLPEARQRLMSRLARNQSDKPDAPCRG